MCVKMLKRLNSQCLCTSSIFMYLHLYILGFAFKIFDVYPHNRITTAFYYCKTANLLPNGSTAVQLQMKGVTVSVHLRIKKGLVSESITYFLVKKPSYFHQCEEKILDSSNIEIKRCTVIFSLKVTQPTSLSLIFCTCSVGMQEAAAA